MNKRLLEIEFASREMAILSLMLGIVTIAQSANGQGCPMDYFYIEMAAPFSRSEFEQIMGALVRLEKLVKVGDLYFAI